MKHRSLFLAVFLLFFLAFPLVSAHAQDRDDDDDVNEPPTELEIGPEVEVPLAHELAGFGGSASLQLTCVPNWLELELGVGAHASRANSEVEAECMFEKPFQISDITEFMVEIGPSLSRSTEGDESGTALTIQTETGFFVWPNKNLGWYANVGWSDVPRNGAQSLSAGAGILVPLGF